MIEAVGHEHLRSYFSQIGKMLKPGGKAVIQVRVCVGVWVGGCGCAALGVFACVCFASCCLLMCAFVSVAVMERTE